MPRRGTAPGVAMNRQSGRSSVVVAQHPTQSFPACKIASRAACLFPRFYQTIAQSLVVSLAVVVEDEFLHSSQQSRLAEEDQPMQAFVFDQSHETLDVR